MNTRNIVVILGIAVFLAGFAARETKRTIDSQTKRIDRLEYQCDSLSFRVDSLYTLVKQDTTQQRIDSLQTRLLHLELWNEIFSEYYPWIAKEIRTRQEQMSQDAIPAE